MLVLCCYCSNCSVDIEEIQALYGSKFMITKVDSDDITLSGGEACNEDVYLLERNEALA